MKYIDVKNISFSYDKETVLENISFHINNSELVAITGENGTAKTTLIKLIIGILRPSSGSIEISRKNINGDEIKLSYLPQQIASFNSGFPTTVYEFVKSGLYRKKSWFKKFTGEDEDAIEEALRLVGMQNRKNEKIGILSGGQKQRIVIARMLVSKSDIYILDEPTTGMDFETRNNFYTIIQKIIEEMGATVIMITHDLDAISNIKHRNLHLSKKNIIER